MAAVHGTPDVVGRAVKVVTRLPSAARVGSGAAGETAEADAVRRSLEALAASLHAVGVVEGLHSASVASFSAVGGGVGAAMATEADRALCERARTVELGIHGPHIALLLHQESLDKLPTGAPLSNGAARILGLLRDARQRLAAARERRLPLSGCCRRASRRRRWSRRRSRRISRWTRWWRVRRGRRRDCARRLRHGLCSRPFSATSTLAMIRSRTRCWRHTPT